MKYVFYGLIVLVVGFAGFMIYDGSGGPSVSGGSQVVVKPGEVLKITTEITNRSYSPKNIEVPLGTEIELTVINNDNEQHGLNIQQFGVNDFIEPLGRKTVRFTADKLGQAATFCAVDHPEKFLINVI